MRVGEVYRHYKGNYYRIKNLSLDVNGDEAVQSVTYEDKKGNLYTQSVERFESPSGVSGLRRFALVMEDIFSPWPTGLGRRLKPSDPSQMREALERIRHHGRELGSEWCVKLADVALGD